jgi:RNA polymerase sigma-70 factor (ECF subfamily)
MASVLNLDSGRSDRAFMDHQPAGDGQVEFRQLFTSTYSRLVAYARRRTLNSAEADDVVAEVYAIAWRRRSDLPTDGPALPWLYGIAANVVRNSRRAGSRRLQLVERLQADPTVHASAVDAEDQAHDQLRLALERLSWDDQEVLRLVTWEGLSHAEAGQALDCSTNAVGIRIHRARQRLENELALLTSSEVASRPAGAETVDSTNDSNSDSRQGGADR